MLDFYLPGGNNLPINGEIDLNINMFHNTENQGDFNWTNPNSGGGGSSTGGGTGNI